MHTYVYAHKIFEELTVYCRYGNTYSFPLQTISTKNGFKVQKVNTVYFYYSFPPANHTALISDYFFQCLDSNKTRL